MKHGVHNCIAARTISCLFSNFRPLRSCFRFTDNNSEIQDHPNPKFNREFLPAITPEQNFSVDENLLIFQGTFETWFFTLCIMNGNILQQKNDIYIFLSKTLNFVRLSQGWTILARARITLEVKCQLVNFLFVRKFQAYYYRKYTQNDQIFTSSLYHSALENKHIFILLLTIRTKKSELRQ